MKKILFVFAHPNLGNSRANRAILESVRNLPNFTLDDIYQKYPEFHIRLDEEKRLLQENDLIVFQHPFYWYSVPPLLKFWMDAVLEFGFAYGPSGNALRGKHALFSITAGGPANAYRKGGENNFPIEAFFPPLEQTLRTCGMHWHPPIVLHHALQITDDQLQAHAEHVRDRILELTNKNFTAEH